MGKRMLVLLDGSKIAEVVFSYARELSSRLGLDLDLLHVCTAEEAQQLPMRQAYIEHMAEILKYADENQIDIILLSTHVRSGIRRWGLGSVADKVIHEARVPIWLAPAYLHEGILIR